MYSLSAICRLSTPLAVSIFGANVAVAETTTVGAVDKVQAHERRLAVGKQFRRRGHRQVPGWDCGAQLRISSVVATASQRIDAGLVRIASPPTRRQASLTRRHVQGACSAGQD
jgi:hypothetical protein